MQRLTPGRQSGACIESSSPHCWVS